MLKSKLLKGAISAIMVVGASCMPALTVYAENSIPTDTVGNVEKSSSNSKSSSSSSAGEEMPSSDIITNEDVGLPTVTTDEIGDNLIETGYTIVDKIRAFGVVICSCAFVVGVFLAIFGAISKKGTIWTGVVAMCAAGFGFTLIWWAPYILAYFKTLLSF